MTTISILRLESGLILADIAYRGPTVILDAGMGLNSLDWSLVQPKIAEFCQVCSFDRAGYGWSDLSPLKRTSKNIVKKLHALLTQAGIPGPYILVGHSFGGANARLYASCYPDEVYGVVLVDASSEEQLKKLPPPLPPNLEKMVFLSTEGILRIRNHLPNNRKEYTMFPDLIQKMYLATNSATKAVKANIKEEDCITESLTELKIAGGYLGNRPLIVITAGIPPTPEETGMTEEQIKKMTQIWHHLQKDLLKNSSHSKQVIARKSNHLIPRYQPEIIVESVREMIHEYRQ